jgi:hypothetical protein
MKVELGNGVHLPFPLNWIIGLPIVIVTLFVTAIIVLGVALILLSPILLIIWLVTAL